MRVIEALAGAAFVVCQSQITAVAKRTRVLYDAVAKAGHSRGHRA